MKISALRELTSKELNEKLYSLKENLFELNKKKAVGNLENPCTITGVRKDIARINLILRERELSEANK